MDLTRHYNRVIEWAFKRYGRSPKYFHIERLAWDAYIYDGFNSY